MTYFQNINSLADLKREYRRLALQHHPDKGGDTAVMQQVNVEFEKLYDVWKDSTNMSADTTGYEYHFFLLKFFDILMDELRRTSQRSYEITE